MAKTDLLSRLTSVPGNAPENAVVVKEESELATAAAASSDSIGAAKFGLWALGIGFGGFLLWAAFAPLDEGVPSPVLTTSLYERFSSRGAADFADKLLSAMRYEFGGHLEKAAGK